MNIVHDVATFREVRQGLTGSVGFVPTMGALHDGHLSLVRSARNACDHVVVSIYVNPLQFGPNEDLQKYPRQLEQDCKLLDSAGADIVFAPASLNEQGADTYVVAGQLAKNWCGRKRPGHFDGVLTVITKLFNLVCPSDVWLGQKDFQQFRVIQKWVEDMLVNVRLHCHPVVRDADGLALSSRNQYLSDSERSQALALSASIRLAESLFQKGQTDSREIIKIIQDHLQELEIDYVAIVAPEDLKPVKVVKKGDLLLLAAIVGTTRLIDNTIF